jgi:hypothetical protein
MYIAGAGHNTEEYKAAFPAETLIQDPDTEEYKQPRTPQYPAGCPLLL